jgi:hypothetical protein
MYQMLHELDARAFNNLRNARLPSFVVRQLGTKLKKLREVLADEPPRLCGTKLKKLACCTVRSC